MAIPRLEWAAEWLEHIKENYIGGAWHEASGAPFQLVNPATGSPLATLCLSTTTDANAAVQAARGAFNGAAQQLKRRDRARILQTIARLIRDRAEELATLETLANGKLFQESLEDIPECADVCEYYAGWVDKHYGETAPVEAGFLNYTVHEPVGVCALIVPWNFPLLLAMWKIAPALAMGNTVVVKPSEYTPLSLIRLVQLIHEQLDLPPGLLNLVIGDGVAGAVLAGHPNVDKVSFTGSTVVGREVVKQAAASNLKTVSLELGGKSPNILFADAPDLEATIARSFTSMFSHKGEKCSEPTRILVQRPIYDRVVAALAERANAVKCGDPFAASSEQGPQCNQRQLDKILSYIAAGRSDGARLVAGGERDVTGTNCAGFFVRPTVFADVDHRISIAQEEIFGPVLVAIPFTDEDEAITIANSTPYGLAAGVYTSDVSRAHRMARRLDAGMVFINHYGCYDFASPFGGFRQSGWGKEMARQSLEAYTKTKSVWVKI